MRKSLVNGEEGSRFRTHLGKFSRRRTFYLRPPKPVTKTLTPVALRLSRSVLLACLRGLGLDGRPRQLVASYIRHIIHQVDSRRIEVADDDNGEALELVLRGLAPARLGMTIAFLSPSAEEMFDEMKEFIAVATTLADDEIASAASDEELLYACLRSLDRLHSFLLAHDLVGEEYVRASTGSWLDVALASINKAAPSEPEAYEALSERTPDPEPTFSAAKDNLAYAA
jgi:hypothetical protein